MFSGDDQTVEHRFCVEEDHKAHNTVSVKDENEEKKKYIRLILKSNNKSVFSPLSR